MFCFSVACLTVEIDNRYPYVKQLCRDYIVEYASARPDFRVRATSAEIEARVERTNKFLSPEKAEAYVLFDKICKQLPKFDAIMLHSAVVEYGGVAYAFSAPRGVGKTTHAGLWIDRFGTDARILCGDKPILRNIGGEWLAFGTPWGGKEGIHVNASARLGGIFFLERAQKSSTVKITPEAFVSEFFAATVVPDASNEPVCRRFCDALGDIYAAVPCFKLLCNVSQGAVDAALDAIRLK